MPEWREILEQDGPSAWRAAYRLLGDRADADECFQEACLAAFEVSRREPVRNWRSLLIRLASARAVDRLRQRRRHRMRESSVDWSTLPGTDPPGSRVFDETELVEKLREALTRIPPKQAQVFCLHCLEGLSYEQISEELGLSLSAVGVLLHRGRERLRRLLGQKGNGPVMPGSSHPRKEAP